MDPRTSRRRTEGRDARKNRANAEVETVHDHREHHAPDERGHVVRRRVDELRDGERPARGERAPHSTEHLEQGLDPCREPRDGPQASGHGQRFLGCPKPRVSIGREGFRRRLCAVPQRREQGLGLRFAVYPVGGCDRGGPSECLDGARSRSERFSLDGARPAKRFPLRQGHSGVRGGRLRRRPRKARDPRLRPQQRAHATSGRCGAPAVASCAPERLGRHCGSRGLHLPFGHGDGKARGRAANRADRQAHVDRQ